MTRTPLMEIPSVVKIYESIVNAVGKSLVILVKSKFGRGVCIFGLYTALLLFIYHGIFDNWINLNFADLGTFPLYPTLTSRLFFYSWQIQGLGFPGNQLPYGLIVDGLTLLFGNPGIAEKVWLLSLLPIASTSMYLLSRRALLINSSGSVFISFLFSFNPVTAGLIYTGSVNDTLTAYSFFPLLIFLATVSLNVGESLLKWVRNVIIFSILFIYVFNWNQQIIMWVGPFYLFYAMFLLMRRNPIQDKLRTLLSGVIFVIIFTALTGSLTTILQFLNLHGSGAFSVSAGGTNSAINIAIDLRDNFYGQFSFQYWYLAAGVLTLNASLFHTRKRRGHLSNDFILHYAIIVEVLFILNIWLIFRVDATSLIIFLSRYFPIIGAYEPFPAIVILFSLLFIDTCLVMRCVNLPLYLHSFHATDSEVIRAIGKSLPKLFAILLVLLILFSSAPFWRDSSTPSTFSMIQQSTKVNELYSVPSGISEISSWFYGNASPAEQSRVLLVPQGGYLDEELAGNAPWVSFIPISHSLYSQFQPMLHYNITSNLANLLSIFGVKYVVVYKGPYPKGDSHSAFSGNVRFSPSGPPWQLQYTPHGSWQNWSTIFLHCKNFSLVANLSNADIFYNTLCKGIIYSFDMGNSSFSLNTVTFSQTENELLYPTGPNLVTNNWSGLNLIPWRYNWTESENGGNLQLKGGGHCQKILAIQISGRSLTCNPALNTTFHLVWQENTWKVVPFT